MKGRCTRNPSLDLPFGWGFLLAFSPISGSGFSGSKSRRACRGLLRDFTVWPVNGAGPRQSVSVARAGLLARAAHRLG